MARFCMLFVADYMHFMQSYRLCTICMNIIVGKFYFNEPDLKKKNEGKIDFQIKEN